MKRQLENVIKTNYFGTLNLSNALLPYMRPDGRVVHVSSDWGCLFYLKNKHFQNKLSNKELTVEQISAIMNEYIE